jgi:hypothetical protein
VDRGTQPGFRTRSLAQRRSCRTVGASERERDPLPGRGSSRSRPGPISARPRAGPAERRTASCLGGGGRGGGGSSETRSAAARGEEESRLGLLRPQGGLGGVQMRGPTQNGPWCKMGDAIGWRPVEAQPSPALVPAEATAHLLPFVPGWAGLGRGRIDPMG